MAGQDRCGAHEMLVNLVNELKSDTKAGIGRLETKLDQLATSMGHSWQDCARHRAETIEAATDHADSLMAAHDEHHEGVNGKPGLDAKVAANTTSIERGRITIAIMGTAAAFFAYVLDVASKIRHMIGGQ